MKYMLDTNICIYAIKNKPMHVLQKIYENMAEGLCLSAITLTELEYGIANSASPDKNSAALLQFVSILEILPFDDFAAAQYGQIRSCLQRKGTPIGTLDMLIAAHALSEDLILVTNNTREFERVPGLRIIDWI